MLLAAWLSLASAFYFHMAEREEKCIIEDIPSDTLITGREWPGPGRWPRAPLCRCAEP